MSSTLNPSLVPTADESTAYEKVNTVTGVVHPPEKQRGALAGVGVGAGVRSGQGEEERKEGGDSVQRDGKDFKGVEGKMWE